MKQQILTTLLVLCSAILFAQSPSNDAFESAKKIILFPNENCVSISGTTLYANESPKLNDGLNDVWYSFTAKSDLIKISLENVISFQDDKKSNVFVELYSDEDYQKGQLTSGFSYSFPFVFNHLSVGKEYFLRIKTEKGNEKSVFFDLCLSIPNNQSTNADCSKAEEIAVNAGLDGDLSKLGVCAIPGLSYDNNLNAVWYKFKAKSKQHNVNLQVLESALYSGNQLVISVFKGLTCEKKEDVLILRGGLRFNTIIDSIYYIAVYQNTFGLNSPSRVKFNISVTTPPAPTNDDCATPTLLIPSKNTTFLPKTKGSFDWASGKEIDYEDVWYSFVATKDFHYLYFKQDNVQNNNAISFFISIFDENQSCKKDSFSIGFYSSLDSLYQLKNLNIGKKYWVKVKRSLFDPNDINKNADFHISVGEKIINVPNDECKNAIEIPVQKGKTCQNPTIANSNWATQSDFTDDIDKTFCGKDYGEQTRDIWYKFTPNSTVVGLNIKGGYRNITLLKSLNDSCSEFAYLKCIKYWNTLIVLDNLQPNEVYFLRVLNTSENVELCLQELPNSPPNNALSNATTLVVNDLEKCNAPVLGTLLSTNYETNVYPSCSGEYPDVWYKFTATHDAHQVHLNWSNPISGTQLTYRLYELENGNLQSLNCYTKSLLNGVFYTKKGTTYYISVQEHLSSFLKPDTFEICVSTPLGFAIPANDELCNAVNLEKNEAGSAFLAKKYSTKGGNKTAAYPKFLCKNSDNLLDIWFKFKAVNNEALLVRSNAVHQDSVAIKDYELSYELYELEGQRCDTLIRKTCTTDLKENNLLQNLNEGKSYTIRVLKYNLGPNQYIDFGLHIDTFPKGNPKNDFCKNAINLPMNIGFKAVSATKGKLYNATSDNISSDWVKDCSFAKPKYIDVWYQFTATQAVHVVRHSVVYQDNSVIMTEVFEGNCDNLQQIGCEKLYDGETLLEDLTVGTTYYIRVHYSYVQPNVAPDKITKEFEIAVIAPTQIISKTCSQAVEIPVTSYQNSITIHRETAVNNLWHKFKPKQSVVILNFSNIYGNNIHNVEFRIKDLCSASTISNDYIRDNKYIPLNGLDTSKTYFINFVPYGNACVAFDFQLHYLDSPTGNAACEIAQKITVNPSLIATTSIKDTFNDRYRFYDIPKRWYEFTATQSTHYLIITNVKHSLTQYGFRIKDNFYSINCKVKSGSFAGLNDTTFRLERLTTGQKYRFELVPDLSNEAIYSTYNIAIITPPIHPYDECDNAALIDLAAPKTTVMINHEWTSLDNINVPGCVGGLPSIWYKFKPKKQNYSFQFDNFSNSNSL